MIISQQTKLKIFLKIPLNKLEIAINIYLVLIQYYMSLLLLIYKEIVNHYINKVKYRGDPEIIFLKLH